MIGNIFWDLVGIELMPRLKLQLKERGGKALHRIEPGSIDTKG